MMPTSAVNVLPTFKNCFFHSYALHLLANNLPYPSDLFSFDSILPESNSYARKLQAVFPTEEAFNLFFQSQPNGQHIVAKTLILGVLLREWMATRLSHNSSFKQQTLKKNHYIIAELQNYKNLVSDSMDPRDKELILNRHSFYLANRDFLDYYANGSDSQYNDFEKYFSNTDEESAVKAFGLSTKEQEKLALKNKPAEDIFYDPIERQALANYWNRQGFQNYCTYLATHGNLIGIEDIASMLVELGQGATIQVNGQAQYEHIAGRSTTPLLELELDEADQHYMLAKTAENVELLESYEAEVTHYLSVRAEILDQNSLLLKKRVARKNQALCVECVCPEFTFDKPPFELMIEKLLSIQLGTEGDIEHETQSNPNQFFSVRNDLREPLSRRFIPNSDYSELKAVAGGFVVGAIVGIVTGFFAGSIPAGIIIGAAIACLAIYLILKKLDAQASIKPTLEYTPFTV